MEDIIVGGIKNITFIAIILSIIQLFNLAFLKADIERHILKDTMKTLMHIARLIFLTLTTGLLGLYMIDVFSTDSILDYPYNQILVTYIQICVLTFLVSFIVYLLFVLLSQKSFYFFEDKEKIFIVKSIDSNHVLLSNDRLPIKSSVRIIETKEYLVGKEIHMESVTVKDNVLDTINFYKKLFTFKKPNSNNNEAEKLDDKE